MAIIFSTNYEGWRGILLNYGGERIEKNVLCVCGNNLPQKNVIWCLKILPECFKPAFAKLGPTIKMVMIVASPTFSTLKALRWMKKNIMIQFIWHIPFWEVFGPQASTKWVRNFFLLLHSGVPFRFSWKLSFPPNLPKVVLTLSYSSRPLLQNCVFFQLFLSTCYQIFHKRLDLLLFLI